MHSSNHIKNILSHNADKRNPSLQLTAIGDLLASSDQSNSFSHEY